MRLVTAAALLGIATGAAHAADYPPVLRGSNAYETVVPGYVNWSGFYVGGHIGYASGAADFGDSGSDLIANILRNTVIENEFNISDWLSPNGHGNGTPVGIFFGYNWQSDDVVFGFDVTYSHTSLSAGGSDALARNITTAGGVNYDVYTAATMLAKVTDILSIRGRGGVTFGAFMPYGTLGVAVGRVDIERAAAVRTVQYDDSTPPLVVSDIFEAASDSKKGAIAYGISAGLGFDWQVVPNVFLRAEYEYVGFASVKDVSIAVHTARAGLGARF